MEEDIKILEEFIEKTDVDYKCNYNECVIPYEIEQILKRFIKRYKELEEENSSIKYLNEGLRLDKNILTDMVNDLQEQKRKLEVENKTLKETEPVSIPISVIQNKKSEIEKQLQEYEESDMEQDDDYFFDVNAFQGEIAVLDEILEKGNK